MLSYPSARYLAVAICLALVILIHLRPCCGVHINSSRILLARVHFAALEDIEVLQLVHLGDIIGAC